jgi:hypothetical protein
MTKLEFTKFRVFSVQLFRNDDIDEGPFIDFVHQAIKLKQGTQEQFYLSRISIEKGRWVYDQESSVFWAA